MATRRDVLLAASAVGLGACSAGRSWNIRYRLTLHLSVRGEKREVSSVYRTWLYPVSELSLNQTERFGSQAWGQAILVDLGADGFLAAILNNLDGTVSSHYFAPHHLMLLPSLLGGALAYEDFRSGDAYDRVQTLEGDVDLPAEYWPLLVHFTNLADRSTAKLLHLPSQTYSDNVGVRAAIGSVVQAHRVTVRVVRDQVTRGIERRLPWFDELAGARSGLTLLPVPTEPLPERLAAHHFRLNGPLL